MATTYDIGDKIRETCTFANAAGTATDPTAITCHVEKPSGTVVSHTYPTSTALSKSGTGVYLIDITTTGAGAYEIRFTGTGGVVASQETYFSVRARRVST